MANFEVFMEKIKLSPSLIGKFFEAKCARELWARYNRDNRVKEGDSIGALPGPVEDRGYAEAGIEWEKEVIKNLSAGTVLEEADNSDKKFTVDETIDCLKNLNNKMSDNSVYYLYQLCLEPNNIYPVLDNYKNVIEWSNAFYPDLIEAKRDEDGERIKLTVVDIKSAADLKEGYQIQIALYARMLEKLIIKEGLGALMYVDNIGKVWNRGEVHIGRMQYEDIYENDDIDIHHSLLERCFSLEEANNALEEFFSNVQLNQFVGENMSDINCIRSSECEFCKEKSKCYKLLLENDSVKALPLISNQAQILLDELAVSTCEDLFDLIRQRTDEDKYKKLNSDPYLRDVCVNADAYEKCMAKIRTPEDIEENRFVKDATTNQFPKATQYNDYNVILTAQKEPYTGRVYAYGRYIDGINEKGDFKVCFSQSRKSESLDANDVAFINDLYDCLEEITKDESNRLQFYFMDSYERSNMMNALYGVLNRINASGVEKNASILDKNNCFKMNDEVAKIYRKTQEILFSIPDERMASYSDKLPYLLRGNPASIISSVIKRLYVLPIKDVNYDLVDIGHCFGYKFADENGEEHFKSYMGYHNSINNDRIKAIWDKKASPEDKKVSSEELKSHIKARLELASSVINEIQDDEKNEKIILSKEPELYKSANININDNVNRIWNDAGRIKEKLLFEAYYESLKNKNRVSNIRTKSLKALKEDATVLKLEYIKEVRIPKENGESESSQENETLEIRSEFRVCNYADFKGNMWFAGVLIDEADDEKESGKILFGTDFEEYPIEPGGFTSPSQGKFYLGMIDKKPEERNGEYYINLLFKEEYTGENGFDGWDEGKEFLLVEYHLDINLSTAVQSLYEAKEVLFNPGELVFKDENNKGKINVPVEGYKKLLDDFSHPEDPETKNIGFSDSQEKAFKHILSRKLTLLSGPPAAGKTDFIARSVIAISDYCAENNEGGNKNLKILVSAMSHAAIDNILEKIQSKLLNENYSGNGLELYKAGRIESKKLKDANAALMRNDNRKVKNISNENKWNEAFATRKTMVVGATGWALNKYDAKEFDLIIIDEASQVRLVDAFLQLNCSNENTRFLFVGDSNQLPPIIAGNYDPESNSFVEHDDDRPQNRVNVFGSIFDFIETSLGEGHEDICKLNDNFRMNSILCRYSARGIYRYEEKNGQIIDEYRAYNESIANQKLTLTDKTSKEKEADELIDDLLDPEYPLVFVKMKGSSADQRELDLNLVNSLVKRFWNRTVENDENKEAEAKIKDFWGEKCGIISPYHAHIKSVKSYVSKSLKCKNDDIFIGTVDKLQGQERDMVIVTYGMYDEDRLLSQSEFIFSKNRFNVSLTRGRQKTIVILSDVVAEGNLTSNVLRNKTKTMREGIDFVHGFTKYMTTPVDNENYKDLKEGYPSKYENRDQWYYRKEDRWINGASLEIYEKRTYVEKDDVKNIAKIISGSCDDIVESVLTDYQKCAEDEKKRLIISSEEQISGWRDRFIDISMSKADTEVVYPIDVRGKYISSVYDHSVVFITANDEEAINKLEKTDISFEGIYVDNCGDRTLKDSFFKYLEGVTEA